MKRKLAATVLAFTVVVSGLNLLTVAMAPNKGEEPTFKGRNDALTDFPPVVVVNTPGSEEQIYQGVIFIDWLATDVEDDDALLNVTIEYSPDAGTNWFTIMSGFDNNNPPYSWDTIAEGVSDGVSYVLNIIATDSTNQSDSNTSYIFSIDNILNDRWFLQVESTNLAPNLDLDMKPAEMTPQEISVDVPAPGEIPVQSFASEFVAPCDVDLAGDWAFAINAKVSFITANGSFYANVYADNGTTPRLLFTTNYDDEAVASYLTYHEFSWGHTVPVGTLINAGDHVVVEIMLHATAGAGPGSDYNLANADIDVLGTVIGDYSMTHVSDNQREIIEEVGDANGTMVIILDEDFAGGIPPDWKVIDGYPGGGNDPARTWTTTNPGNRTAEPPIIDPFAIADSDAFGGGWMSEELITPPLDLSLATLAILEFDQWYCASGDVLHFANVDVSSSLTGNTWTNVLSQTTTSSPNPDHQTINITPLAAGASDVEIRFHYNAANGYWWMVDNVLVQANVNTSLLIHKWTIDIPADEAPYTFSLEARRPRSSDGDDFVFAYSKDNVTYIDMITIDQQVDKIKTYSLPTELSGTVYIRVRDTDRIPGNFDISRIEIDRMFISSGPPHLTVGLDHYSTPSYVEPVLTLGPSAHICIQDAPGDTGTNVTTHTMTTDETFTVWAIGYDAEWNYISDIPVNWTNTLNAQTATTSTSFTLAPTAPGTGTITADFNATISDTTSLITVTVGTLSNIVTRDTPSGLGNIVGAYSMTTDDILTVWAAGYDSDGNYIGDVECDWFTNGSLDMQSANDVNNFTFNPSTAYTSGYIIAVNGSLLDSTGLITVGIGALNYILIMDAPGDVGTEIADVLMIVGENLTIFSAGYDSNGNYICDIQCNWTTTGTLNLTTATVSTSFTFKPSTAGETGTIISTFNATISDETGTINVTDLIDYIVIEDGLGNEVTTHVMDITETLIVWAIGYNSTNGVIGPVNVDWTTTGSLDLQTSSMTQSFTFDPVHAPTSGTIEAIVGSLWDSTGTITVNTGSLTYLCIRDAPGDTGANVTTHTMTTDETLTVWAVGYDMEWNYISEIPSNWTNTLNAQTATEVTVFTLAPTAPGAGTITATFNTTIFDTTGLITVNAGFLAYITIRDAPGGLGNVVGAYSMTTDDILTVWAASYDADGNYIDDVNCDWSTNGTLELQSANDVNNFTFSPSTAGTSGYIIAVNGSLFDSAGLITVELGTLNYIVVMDKPGGTGTEVADVLIILGDSLTVYSAGYDAAGNYIGDVPCNWTTLFNLNETTATNSTSFTFVPAEAGEVGIIRAIFNASILDSTGMITVTDFVIDYIVIEDGLGTDVTTHVMDITETFTVWAIGYNFTEGIIGPVNANWTTTGSLDLQTSSLSQSFTFDPVHAPTSGTIVANLGALSDSTGTITVNLGPLIYICIVDSGLGGNVTTHTMTTDETFTVWAMGYDSEWNYISLIPVNWTNTLNTQTVNSSTSFTLDPTEPGTGIIIATFNATIFDTTGLITVTVGALANIVIRDAPGNTGTEIADVLMILGESLTVYSAGYDTDGNYIGDIPCNWTTTGTLNLTTATVSTSFTFKPSTAGETGTINATFNTTISDGTGIITVTDFVIDYIVIEDAPIGGLTVTTHTMGTTETLTVWAIGYNFTEGIIGPVNANWTTTGSLDLQTSSLSQSFTFDPVHAPTSGTIEAIWRTLWNSTGTITVNPGSLTHLCIQDAPSGIGTNVTTHTMTTDETFTVWAIGYDAEWNFISDAECSWSTTGSLDVQTAIGTNFIFDPITAPTSGTIIAVNATTGLSDETGIITVNPGTLAYLCIQDALGGAGTNVTNYTMTTDEIFTVWAIGYDAEWNHIGNVNCDWTTTGTLDLQTATSVNTFTFSPITPGAGTIIVDDLAGHTDSTGLITVNIGALSYILIRDSPGGLGNVVGAYSMTTDDTLTVWAASYDVDGNYIDDVNCDWTTNSTLDMQSATDVNNFMFDPSTPGTSGFIIATNGSISGSAGLISVGVGVLNYILILDAPGGIGTEVDDVLLVLGQTLTVYSAGYDADGNYIADIPCNWTTTGALNLTTATTSTAFTFEPAAVGETGTINATFNVFISDETGMITVTDLVIDYIVIEDGFGIEVSTHTMDTTETFTVWAVGYNLTFGLVGFVNVNWTTTGTLDPQSATTSQSFTFDPVHAPTSGTIEASLGALWDETGLITVNTGPLAYLCIKDTPGGGGSNVTTHTMTTAETFTLWSVGFDTEWNYIGEIPANWTNTLDSQNATVTTMFVFAPSIAGNCTITAEFNATTSDTTGLITVILVMVSTYNIDLTGIASGTWVLVSFPINATGDVQTVFDDLNWGDGGTMWDYIQWFDPLDVTDHWKTFSIYKPLALNDMPDMDNTMGVWIHITANGGDQMLTVGNGVYPVMNVTINLYTGWNLIGYPSANSSLAIDTLPPEADMVSVYDPGQPYLISDETDLSLVTMEEGQAYWVHVTSDTAWTVMSSQPPDPVEVSFSLSQDETVNEDEGIDTLEVDDDIGNIGLSQDRQSQVPSSGEQNPFSFMVITLFFVAACLVSRRKYNRFKSSR